MEIPEDSATFMAALRDFRHARQQAVLERIAAQLTGKSADLLSYEEVRETLKAGEPIDRGLEQISLAAVAGSVGRYTDFTRSFLPRRETDERHWAEVRAVVAATGNIPPIYVYKVDQVYFVLDGNHRVSIARQLGYSHIPAYVTEIKTEVPLTPDIQPDQLIMKARYVDFLEKTGLHRVRPQANLDVTAPGSYNLLEEQIEMHRRWLAEQREQPPADDEVAAHWYDEVYLPVIDIIRAQGILRHFPNRTETDLYVWFFRHRSRLKEMLGWDVRSETVAHDLVYRFSAKPSQWLQRVKERLVRSLIPTQLEPGPPPGQWRLDLLPHHTDRLFADVLVAVSGTDDSWTALKQAAVIAWREDSRLHGLHVVNGNGRGLQPEAAQRLRDEFGRRCSNAGVTGELTVEPGKVVETISDRARWTDLVVVYLSHLPRPRPDDRLRSRFGALLRSCPRPVLAVPGQYAPLKRALLAYDGSPKANEALFVAAYLAAKWQLSLAVVTVLEANRVTGQTLTFARDYLAERQVTADYFEEQGEIAPAIINTARTHQSDFMIMGGYGFNPVLEVMLGSEVDQILRQRQWPVLICR